MAAMIVEAMRPLLFKLSKLLEEEYMKIRGVDRQIKLMRDELSTMNATLHILADSEEINPQLREWRNKVRELAYDIEDCIDRFMAHADHDTHTCFKWCFSQDEETESIP